MLLLYRLRIDTGSGGRPLLQYKAGFKFVEGGVHAQVLDFPAAITCGADLDEARRLLGIALVDVAEAAIESGLLLPAPNPTILDPEMDIVEPIGILV